jgi:hypothetical protein
MMKIRHLPDPSLDSVLVKPAYVEGLGRRTFAIRAFSAKERKRYGQLLRGNLANSL